MMMPAGNRVLKPCGTRAAFDRHVARGEQPCAACSDARKTYNREHGHLPAEKKTYDDARYAQVRDAKIASAQRWYSTNTDDKQSYDIARRPLKNSRRRADYVGDPEKYLAPQRGEPRRRQQLKKYGLTIAQFDARFEAQGSCCACCKTKTLKGNKSWCVDHNHKTGEIRGITCGLCNTGIGALGDDIAGVENARLYLDPSLPRIDEHY